MKHFTQENRLSVLWAQTLTVTLGPPLLSPCMRLPLTTVGVPGKRPLSEHNEVKTSKAVEPSATGSLTPAENAQRPGQPASSTGPCCRPPVRQDQLPRGARRVGARCPDLSSRGPEPTRRGPRGQDRTSCSRPRQGRRLRTAAAGETPPGTLGPRPRPRRGHAKGQRPPPATAGGVSPRWAGTRASGHLQAAVQAFSEIIDTEIGTCGRASANQLRAPPRGGGSPAPHGLQASGSVAASTLPGVSGPRPPHRMWRCQPHSSLNRFS